MIKKSSKLFRLALLSAVSLSFAACGGRLPAKPVTPISSTTPAPSGAPTAAPSTNPSDPAPKPPAGGPDDGTGDLPSPKPPGPSSPPGPSTPNPPPPDPEQPKTEADFWNLMTRFGFTRTKDDMSNDIKTQLSKKVADWSPGTAKDKDKNIESHFTTAIKGKYFKVPPKDAKDYFARSLALGAKKDGIDYYLDISYGPKGGTINIQKVDAKTLEIIFFNKSSLITNYTQTDGSLLRLAHFMLIPSTVYTGKSSAESLSSGNRW